MNYKQYLATIFLLLLVVVTVQSQVSGTVYSEDNIPINKVQIYNSNGGLLAETNSKGYFEFPLNKEQISVLIYSENFKLKELTIYLDKPTNLKILLNSFTEELSEIQIKARKNKVFELKRLQDVVGTSIYAGKKTEVIRRSIHG